MDKIIFIGEARESGLHIFNRKEFDQQVQYWIGKKLEIILRPKRKRRSNQQNAYYWGVVVPLVRQGLFDVGYRYTNEEVHTMLKEMFWKVEKVNEKTGEIKMITGSTTQMTTVDKMDYLEQIIQWAAEFLGVIIPAPGEQTNIEFE